MNRRILTTIAACVTAAATTFAQGSIPARPDASDALKTPSLQAAQMVVHSSERSLSSMIAYGSVSLGGDERFGPTLILQYSPNRLKVPAVDFFAGVLIQSGTSAPVDTRNYIPVASMFAPYYSPYSDYRNNDIYRMPHLSIGMAFLGSDLTFYMAEGSVRPYLGVGGSLAFWSYARELSGTLAPDAKAGLAVQIARSFSGFAEVRRLFGVPNLIGTNTPRFGGMTSAALGISFAPRLR